MQNQQVNWKKDTLQLYAALPRSISNADITRETGLSATWLTDFLSGHIKEPGIEKVNTLYNYLKLKINNSAEV